MKSKVVPLRVLDAPELPEAVVPDIVAVLEWMLREAKAGRVTGMAMSVLRKSRKGVATSATMFAGPEDDPAELDRLIGSVATLQHRLVAKTLADFSVAPTDAPTHRA